MKYLELPVLQQVKKVVRYLRLYGPAVTRVKVLGQLHMKRRFETLPPVSVSQNPAQVVGLVGCGNYAFTTIAHFLRKYRGNVIASCMDIDVHRAASLSNAFKIPHYTVNAEEVFANAQVRLVYIASNHATHAEYAIQALYAGKDVYIEKPHVVNEDQLKRLVKAMHETNGRVFLGFNRPGSRFGRIILDYLHGERGSGMYNWFVAGHIIDPDHWYFRPEEGGRVLGNLCHWTDFVLQMAGPIPFPVRINPTRGTVTDSDIAVAYTFPDETIAVITFSAKGPTFEGVKERFSAQKGNVLLTMADYRDMTVEIADRKVRYVNRYRDHGHRTNILAAYDSSIGQTAYDRQKSLKNVANTAWLFLKTRNALESNTVLTVNAYEDPVAKF